MTWLLKTCRVPTQHGDGTQAGQRVVTPQPAARSSHLTQFQCAVTSRCVQREGFSGSRAGTRFSSGSAGLPALRVGVNFGNTQLVSRNAAGLPVGIVPDLLPELSNWVNRTVEIVPYTSAGRMAEGATRSEWDIAFLGRHPAREETMDFTRPYLQIDLTLLVRKGEDGTTRSLGAILDDPTARVGVSGGSEYDLALQHRGVSCEIVREPSMQESLNQFANDTTMTAVAGPRGILDAKVEECGGSEAVEVLATRFGRVSQAVAMPLGGGMAIRIRAIDTYIRYALRTGSVHALIEKHSIRGATACPSEVEGDEVKTSFIPQGGAGSAASST